MTKLPDNFDTVMKSVEERASEEVNRISRKSHNWKYQRTYKKKFNKKLNSKKWTTPQKSMR